MHGETKKSFTKTINSKYQLLRGMTNLNYLPDHIMYHIKKNQKNRENTDNPSTRLHVNKI